MYDQSIGRFTTNDPLGFGAGDPNLFRFVGNGPTNATDPSGMEIFKSSEKAPNNVVFADELLWAQTGGPDITGMPTIFHTPTKREVEQNNQALKAMKEWRKIDSKYFDMNIYYVTDAYNGPVQFARHAAKNGPGSINLYFGHGATGEGEDILKVGKEMKEIMDKYNLDSKSDPDAKSAPLFGMWCCYPTRYNEMFPESNTLKEVPKSKDQLSTARAWTDAAPMIIEADTIISYAIKLKQHVTLNLYFGEQEKRLKNGEIEEIDQNTKLPTGKILTNQYVIDNGKKVLISGNTDKYGGHPAYRYRLW